MDAEKSESFGGRATTPEDLRLAAIDLRQQGDALFKSSPAAAEAKYKQATANDPIYDVPYLRLADICLGRKDMDGAREILKNALAVDGMSSDSKNDLTRKLDSISK